MYVVYYSIDLVALGSLVRVIYVYVVIIRHISHCIAQNVSQICIM